MSKGIYVALSGARAQENALEATATNMANASSNGYQRLRPIFRRALANAQNGNKELVYGSIDRTALDTSAGAFRKTDRALDVALPQGAYLAVSTPRGERFTRAGSLVVGDDGTLKTQGGAALSDGNGGAIKVTPGGGEVQITPDGSVMQGKAAVGKLRIVQVEKPDALVPEGAGLLAIGNGGAVTESDKRIEVGSLEDSNAQPVGEMTELMSASRTFDAFQKVLDTMSEVDRRLLTTVPNPGE